MASLGNEDVFLLFLLALLLIGVRYKEMFLAKLIFVFGVPVHVVGLGHEG